MIAQQNKFGKSGPGNIAKVLGWEDWLQQWFWWLLIIGLITNATGLFVTILDSDGTLYATIAKTIAVSGDFVNLKVDGKDWLDKPHLPFWIAAISYKIFGINTFAYKFPALLCWLMGLLYTWAFAQKLYNKSIARLSVLLYITAAHLVISNNDVRAEPYLTGFIIGSVYHFYIVSQQKKLTLHIVAASLLAALAVMTKGPFVLICIAAGFMVDWISKKKWQQFVNYKWLLAFLLIDLFSLPEIYSLYVQFDIHPEKIVFGQTNVSGLRFFFWDSQFGRFLNNGPIKGKGDYFFYFHTILWALLPWSVLFYLAMYRRISSFRSAGMQKENITIGAGLIMLLIFSLSKFQLPHYLNILFPFFCIIIGDYLFHLDRKKEIIIIRIAQYVIVIALFILLGIFIFFYRPQNLVVSILYVLGLLGISFLLFRGKNIPDMIGRSFVSAAGVFIFLNIFFYPSAMQYQSGSEAAFFSNTTNVGADRASVFGIISHSFTFYTKLPLVFGDANELKTITHNKPLLIYTTYQGRDSLQKAGFDVKTVNELPFFHASEVTGKFLNYKTRPSSLQYHFLVLVTWLKEN